MTEASPSMLLADDDRDLRELVQSFLYKVGYQAIAVGTGAEALQVFDSDRPRVAILDVSMPGVDGITACVAMKRVDPDIYVLVVSAADARDEILALAPRERPDAFLLKPFGLSSLLEVLTYRPRHFDSGEGQPGHGVVLEGDLATTPFWHVLARSARDRLSGLLRVDARPKPLEVGVANGIPLFAQGGDVSTTLGRILVREGALSELRYQEALALLAAELERGSGVRLGEVLARERFLSPVQIADALARQVEEKILHLFAVREGRFRLVADTSFVNRTACFRQSPESLLHRGLSTHATDAELATLLQPLQDVRIGLPQDHADRLGAFRFRTQEYRVLRLLDGTLTCAEVLARSPLERRASTQVVAVLALTGMLVTGLRTDPVAVPASTEELPVLAAPPEEAPSRSEVPQPPALSEEGERANRIVLDYLGFGAKTPQELLGVSSTPTQDEVDRALARRLADLDPGGLPAGISGDLRNMASVLHQAVRRAAHELRGPRADAARPGRSKESTAREREVQAEMNFRSGESLMGRGDYARAIDFFLKASEQSPGTAEYWLALGWATFRVAPGTSQARTDGAACIRKAIDIDERQPLAYYYLSRIVKLEGDVAMAANLRRKALDMAGATEDGADDSPTRSWTERLKFWR